MVERATLLLDQTTGLEPGSGHVRKAKFCLWWSGGFLPHPMTDSAQNE